MIISFMTGELNIFMLADLDSNRIPSSRAVRESGHDTTYRFEKICGNLGTIDLNSLLYKYEVDIAAAKRSALRSAVLNLL